MPQKPPPILPLHEQKNWVNDVLESASLAHKQNLYAHDAFSILEEVRRDFTETGKLRPQTETKVLSILRTVGRL